MTRHIPIALTIAGSDSGGGAGIQADLKTFGALGVYGASVTTALTAQNTRGVAGVFEVPADFVTAQIDAVFDDLAVDAVKIGMVSRVETVAAIVAGLKRWPAKNIVVDPVMIATSGDRLLSASALDALRGTLIPLARIVTPNLPEAAALLGEPLARTEGDIMGQGERLMKLGAPAVLIKGGHGEGPQSIDYLFSSGGVVQFAAPRIATANTHGTGCSLSSAIAAGLAQDKSLNEAVGLAKDFISAAIAAADRLGVGHGHGPIHHFHALDR
ncbi:MAG: bifunctional hydroxymethylpyrimidine kinase/phosphomethylpyrimidine kinase [Bradyrhizobiaceae bacterium]|nr:MAG: bifunctional hydroxymethylpyrimidine kinase/phosphomethylpyrimidine kinase [Bradyrhizobiaceae bacterium]